MFWHCTRYYGRIWTVVYIAETIDEMKSLFSVRKNTSGKIESGSIVYCYCWFISFAMIGVCIFSPNWFVPYSFTQYLFELKRNSCCVDFAVNRHQNENQKLLQNISKCSYVLATGDHRSSTALIESERERSPNEANYLMFVFQYTLHMFARDQSSHVRMRKTIECNRKSRAYTRPQSK